jgi:hypothetical protein
VILIVIKKSLIIHRPRFMIKSWQPYCRDGREPHWVWLCLTKYHRHYHHHYPHHHHIIIRLFIIDCFTFNCCFAFFVIYRSFISVIIGIFCTYASLAGPYEVLIVTFVIYLIKHYHQSYFCSVILISTSHLFICYFDSILYLCRFGWSVWI